MIELSRRPLGLHVKQIWFSDHPHDIEDCDAVRFYNCNNDVHIRGFRQTPQSSMVINLSRGKEIVWDNISSKCKVGIKKAQRDGLQIRRNQDYELFMKMNDRLRNSKGIMPSTYPIEFLRQNCMLSTSEVDGEIVAGIAFLVDGVNMLGILAASNRLEVDKAKASLIANANRLLWWDAIQYGLENGVSALDMGGYVEDASASSSDLGVNEFKRRFGGEVVRYFCYEKEYSFKAKMGRAGIRSLGRFSDILYSRDW